VAELITTATSADVAEGGANIAVLPIGSFEQHGPYLPLATDTIVACVIAREIAVHYPVLLLPPITIACSHEHAAWPGTVSISARTLHQIVTDIADSLERAGVDRLVLVNGHGGNYVLSNIVQEASVRGPRMALFPSSADWNDARRTAEMETNNHDDMHAGELETSLLLWSYPECVRPRNETADWETERPYFLTHGLQRYTTSGVVGRPSAGTAGKGKAALDSLVSAAGRLLSELIPDQDRT
jgi:creatinine amidohydrolase